MHRFFQLVGRFVRNEDGAFIALFGVMAIVLVALSGAVVDYVTVEQARNRAQVALDAAALSLQPLIYTNTNEQLSQKAEALLNQQVANDSIAAVIEEISTNDTEGSLYLRARLTVPMTFVSLVGFDEIRPVVIAEATRKKLFVEVALVLDNSGSMAWSSRMTNLKTAAKNAADILFENQDTSDSTSIGVVPFNYWVNIGTGYADAWWMDQNGLSSASWDNFDDDDDDSTPFGGPVDRFGLYDQMSGVSWEGCVEARPQPFDADDTEPNVAAPDTLFVPTFSPDEPDNSRPGPDMDYENDYLADDPAACQVGLSTRFCEITETVPGCNNSGNYCDNWDKTTSYKATYPDGTIDTSNNACSCDGETLLSHNETLTGSWNNKTKTTSYSCNDSYSEGGLGLSERERQERICKYTNSTVNLWGKRGPNAGCVSTPVLALTNVRATVKSRIDAMSSGGYTNIHQGAIWGFHLLSPTEPFAEGREYDTATYKVMILMTDGENTYDMGWGDTDDLNGSRSYTPYGWPVNRRMGDETKSASQMEDLVDNRLLETCTNMKNAGIDIFTIGLEPPNNDVRTMLTNCATDPSQAHFPASSAELGTVFETIAQQLSDLRLAL